jgi:hypothetical protein
MDKVYYWAPQASTGNVGHVSLDISFGEGRGRAEYVSWWPAALNIVIPNGRTVMQSYADDRDGEGGEATGAVELWCLDPDRMRQEWYSAKNTAGYAFYTQNCAAMVQRILIAGGAPLSLSVSRYLATLPTIALPWSVYSLALVIAANSSIIIRQRNEGWVMEKPGWFDDWGSSGPGVGDDGLIR